MSMDALSDLIGSRPGGSGAFGPIPFFPPREDDPIFAGAGNLVDRSISKLHTGDEDGARRAVARAARLGWCADEGMSYGVLEARSALFDEITDSLEAADPTEWAWRDACLAVLADADETQAQVLRTLLAGIIHDYQLPRREARALRHAIGDAEVDAPLGLNEQSSPEQIHGVIWAMVTLTGQIHQHLYH